MNSLFLAKFKELRLIPLHIGFGARKTRMNADASRAEILFLDTKDGSFGVGATLHALSVVMSGHGALQAMTKVSPDESPLRGYFRSDIL